MSDFTDALRRTLDNNEQVDAERAEQRRHQERLAEERREELERQEREQQALRDARHAELVDHLRSLLGELEASAPQSFVTRGGWTESGEEYVVKAASVQLHPKRSLFIELDRDDDEVLVRWSSSVGESIEMWRLLEFRPDMLRTLLLQLVDQSVWHDASRPPTFPA